MFKTLRTLTWSSAYAVSVMVFIAAKYARYFRVRTLDALLVHLVWFYIAWFMVGWFMLLLRCFINRIRCEYKLYFATTIRAVSYEQYMFKLTKSLYWENGVLEIVTVALSIPIRLPILVMSLIYNSRYMEDFLFPTFQGEYCGYDNIQKLKKHIECTYGKKLASGWLDKLKEAEHKDRANLEKFVGWLNNSEIAR